MQGVLNNMLKIDDQEDGTPGLISKALDAAVNSIATGNEKPKAVPRVPICASEDAIAAVIAANKNNIDEINQNIIDSMDSFLGDMMTELAGAGGSGGITEMFSKLGNIKGNLTSALNFEDGKDLFDFEVPTNEAVADYYTFGTGGEGQKQTSLPSNSAISAAVKKVGRILPVPASLETFAEPLKNTLDVNLTDSPLKGVDDVVGDILDMY